MLAWLVSRGCKVGNTDVLNQTSLFYAARDGRNELLVALLEQGLEINHVDTYG